MNRFHTKWVTAALPFVAIMAVVLVSKAGISLVTSPQGTSSLSAQPKITWSPMSLETTLSPAENSTKEFTFTSDQSLQNVLIEPVPAIARFLTVQPRSFATVAANQPQSVRLIFLIPLATTPGKYEGTIHVRLGARTVPQTMKVTITVITPGETYLESTPPRIVYSLFVSPLHITVGKSTVVTVIADVGNGDVGTGPTIISEDVSLLRYSDAEKLITNYGRMYDDGTHADARANDGRYTLQFSITDTAPQRTYFTVAVGYVGLPKPIFAKPIYLTTGRALPSPAEVLQTIAVALEANDMTKVFANVYPSDKNNEILQSLGPNERLGLADFLRSATLSTNDEGIATFTSDGHSITLARGSDDAWKLLSW